MIIRNAEYKDLQTLKDIWKNRFGDEDCFIEWFFNERFIPEYSTIIESEGIIISCLYSMPIAVNVRNREEKGILISGVSTLPDYEGRGLMKKALTHHLKQMRSKGVNVSLLKAVIPEIYYSLEHRLINKVLLAESFNAIHEYSCVKAVNIWSEYEALYNCYYEYACKYSGMVFRSYKDFEIKCREYEQTNSECIAYFADEKIEAYCFCFREAGKLICDQFVSVSKEGYIELISYIKNKLTCESLEIKLPCDFHVDLLRDYTLVHGSSAYIMNIPTVLNKSGLKGFALEIIDPVIEENSGIFSLSGERINNTPSLRISNGFLAQWIFGFKSMAQLVKEGHAICLDSNIIEYMDSLETMPCYCLDEY